MNQFTGPGRDGLHYETGGSEVLSHSSSKGANGMTVTPKFFSATVAMILPVAAAGANELAPLQPGTLALQEHTASIYYTEQSDTFKVVTTIARNNGDGMPKRFIAELMPGQTATIAVGAFDPSASPVVLELHHTGEGLNAQVLLPDATN